jgi:hypothetical protein
MKHSIITTAFALALAGPVGGAFAQDAATLVCAEYAAMDNGGKMQIIAELESLNSEMETSQEVTSAEIHSQLNAECTTDPNALVTDIWKKIREM